MAMSKRHRTISWVLQVLVAVILGQTLFFKFTGAPEAVYIFTTVGAEPWGRIGTGIAELLAVILLLIPRTVIWGALLSAGVMIGAIFSHLTLLGIVVQNDSGTLFVMGLIVFISSLVILFLRRAQIPLIGATLANCGCATK